MAPRFLMRSTPLAVALHEFLTNFPSLAVTLYLSYLALTEFLGCVDKTVFIKSGKHSSHYLKAASVPPLPSHTPHVCWYTGCCPTDLEIEDPFLSVFRRREVCCSVFRFLASKSSPNLETLSTVSFFLNTGSNLLTPLYVSKLLVENWTF